MKLGTLVINIKFLFFKKKIFFPGGSVVEKIAKNSKICHIFFIFSTFLLDNRSNMDKIPVKLYEKTVKFYLEIFEFKVFVQSIIKIIFDLAVKYVWCDYCVFFLLLLISEYVQRNK